MKNTKNKNLNDIVQKVNTMIQKNLSDSKILINDLHNLIGDYLGKYPENSESFFNLPDETIDEILRLYSGLEKEIDEKNKKENLEYLRELFDYALPLV